MPDGSSAIGESQEIVDALRSEAAAKRREGLTLIAAGLERAADEIDRLRAHIFEVHTKRSCSVCKELNDRYAPATIDPARRF